MDRRNIIRRTIKMQQVDFVDRSRAWLRDLETAHRRKGASAADARTVVSRCTGIAPGTLENLSGNRLKTVGAHVYEALRRAAIRQITKDIETLRHELTVAEAASLDAHSDEVDDLEATIAAAVAMISRTKASNNFGRREGRSDAAGGTG